MKGDLDFDMMERPVGFDRDLQAHIGRRLRDIYDEIAHEVVPDRFTQLLEKLKQKGAHQP